MEADHLQWAAVLWRDRPVREIRRFIDGESLKDFAAVLGGYKGPVFYYEKTDAIILRRWAAVLMEEGKDSKQLSAPEEEDLKAFAYSLQTQFARGYITPKELRDLAGIGHTPSERVLISQLLAKWCREGILEHIKKGLYRFVPQPQHSPAEAVLEALKGDE